MQAKFILPADPRWQGFLETVAHDVYHLPSYLSACAGHEGGQALAFLAEVDGASMLLPMVLRTLPESIDPAGKWRDATAPYGYACPLLGGEPNPAQVVRLLAEFQDIGQRLGIVSAFFRFHPLLPLPREPFLEFGTLVDHGETVHFDLSLPPAELEGHMRAGFRHDVRRLERNGFRVVIDAWERLDEFVAIYEQTMRRHAASSYYYFPPRYYQGLRDQLGDHVHLALVLAPGGEELACGSLIFEEAGILEYHLSGSDERFHQEGPTKLLLHYLRDWGKARGNRWFNLGGGVGAQADSLFNFKKGFSRLRGSYTSFRMIVDPAAYGELADWKHGSSDRKLLERRRYFPGYRRPQEREAS
jgi:hypothetical protein